MLPFLHGKQTPALYLILLHRILDRATVLQLVASDQNAAVKPSFDPVASRDGVHCSGCIGLTRPGTHFQKCRSLVECALVISLRLVDMHLSKPR